MNVKRYEWVACDEHACHCDVVESAEGDMVDYEDYAALETRCAALAAENAGLKSFGDKLGEMHNDLNGEGTGIQGRAEVACQQVALEAAMEEFDAIKTPDTDAYLAEVRASGVEMFAAYCGEENSVFVEAKAYYRSLPDAAYEFAFELRKGVQS